MIIRNSIGSTAFLDYGDELITMASGAMSVSTKTKVGTFINGPLSVSASPTLVRFGGIYKFNPMTLTALPSTIISPISTFIVDVPVKNAMHMTAISSMVIQGAAL